MWWDNQNDSEDWQRFKNIQFFGFWGTNKERDEMIGSPGCLIAGIIVIVVIILCVIFVP